ncbi:MAG: OmpA family protein [Gemmatimonadota bacterium]|nr:OmpA family protein [Gemmatimonadota bacterium]
MSIGSAQQRRYLFEVGAGGSFQSFDDPTQLGGGTGGIGRLGIWLPLNFSAEVEGSIVNAQFKPTEDGVSVKSLALSALYNILIGSANSIYLKAGYGSTGYGDCPVSANPPEDPPCGTSRGLLAGLGFRGGLTPVLMLRGEATLTRNRSKPPDPLPSVGLSNFGVNLGLSYMLGSKPIPDADADGILDNRDRCADTPAGAQVDGRGCSSDADGDGVANGVDRCPNTVAGAAVDTNGCPRDSDSDNIPDGLDRCPDTPAGVLVDPRGCPRDSDGDAIPDGLDRCSETARGATVDALGCPGDEDGDGVLDGLDRCPRSAAAADVNAIGCVAGQQPGRATPSAAPVPATPPAEAEAPRDTTVTPPRRPVPRPPVGRLTPGVVPGVGFGVGTARLAPNSYVALDSVAALLLANSTVRVEVSAHVDKTGSPAENLHLTSLQADAVRSYLVTKGVPFQQVVARGYGATVPLTPDTTPRGRAANRRVEIRPIAAGP